jgi:hypothetical protein
MGAQHRGPRRARCGRGQRVDASGSRRGWPRLEPPAGRLVGLSPRQDGLEQGGRSARKRNRAHQLATLAPVARTFLIRIGSRCGAVSGATAIVHVRLCRNIGYRARLSTSKSRPHRRDRHGERYTNRQNCSPDKHRSPSNEHLKARVAVVNTKLRNRWLPNGIETSEAWIPGRAVAEEGRAAACPAL